MSYLKNLKQLFYFKPKNKIRIIRRNNPITFSLYKEIILKCINKININASDDFFKQKYKYYINNFKNIKKVCPNNLNFFSKTTYNIKYYLDRGWNEKESKDFIKNQSKTYTLEHYLKKYNNEEKAIEEFNKVKNKRSKTFISNYIKGNHKIFYRPSQIEYWLNKGYNEEESKKIMFDMYSIGGLNYHNKRRERGDEFLTIRQLKYWIKKGYTIEDAKKELKRIHDTRSLKSCIERYGNKNGLEKFNEINKKWLKSFNNKTEEQKLNILIKKLKNFKRYSKKSIILFEKILEEIKEEKNIEFKKIFYGKNEFFIYDKEHKKISFYDLVIKDINLIIEYNGIMFHPNKNKLSKKEWKNWKDPISKLNADEKLKKDLYKETLAKNKGFEYLIVWEDETIINLKNIIKNKIYELYEC